METKKERISPLSQLKEIVKHDIPIGKFYEHNHERLQLENLTGEVGFENLIVDKNLHRPGLALAGYVELFTYHRVQIFGNTEIHYLNSLSPIEKENAFRRLFDFNLPCIIVTNDNPFEDYLVAIAKEHHVPVFRTPYETTKIIYFLSDYLDDQFAPQTIIHGAFVDVYGIGVLFIGRSGIGKSEIALDLIERGHRLVADDVVMITRKGEGIIMGAGTDLVKHFMEVRGLGLIDIRSIFGVRSIRFQKRVEVIVELEEWNDEVEYDRTGLDSDTSEVLGVPILHVRLPIFPGKNITVISEVIALNYLMKHYGHDSAKEFAARLQDILTKKTAKDQTDRVIQWFEHDFE